jgi:MoxR-like ATPase
MIIHLFLKELMRLLTKTFLAKVRALLDQRVNVSFDDVRQVVLPAMRHRVSVNFEAEAEGMSPDKVLTRLLEETPTTAADVAASSAKRTA